MRRGTTTGSSGRCTRSSGRRSSSSSSTRPRRVRRASRPSWPRSRRPRRRRSRSRRRAARAGTYSDLPLACFWGAGLLLLTSEGAGLAGGLASGLLLGAAVLSKNEGLPLAVAALGASVAWAFAAKRLRANRAPLLAAAGVVAAAALLLLSWRSGIPPRYDEGQVAAFGLVALANGAVARLPVAARACAAAMASRQEWGFTWLLVPLGFVLGARRLWRRDALPLAVALSAALALYASAYALSGWPPAMLAETTWDRLLVQMGLPLFVLLALAVDPRPQSLFQAND